MPNNTSSVILVAIDGFKTTPIRRDILISCSLLMKDVLDDEPSSPQYIEVPVAIPKGEILQLAIDYMLLRANCDNNAKGGRNGTGEGGSQIREIGDSNGSVTGNSNNSVNVEDENYSSKIVSTSYSIPKPLIGPLARNIEEKDYEFVVQWSTTTTLDVLSAANYLNYPMLRELASARLASFVIDMDIEEIRALLGVKSDFTREEEEELRRKHGIP